jgi:hypothetical protein
MIERQRTEVLSGRGADLMLMGGTSAEFPNEPLFQPEKAMRLGIFCDLAPLLEEAGENYDGLLTAVTDAGNVYGGMSTLVR